MGCVGLEMEGYYYAAEVESKIKHKMISPMVKIINQIIKIIKQQIKIINQKTK